MRTIICMILFITILSVTAIAQEDITGEAIASGRGGLQAVGYQDGQQQAQPVLGGNDPAMPEFSTFGVGAVAALSGFGYYFVRRRK